MSKYYKIQKILMLIFICFLLIYHIFKLFNIYFGNDILNSDEFLNSFPDHYSVSDIILFQNILRFIIILSLVTIIFRKDPGLLGMWVGIIGLVITQFIVVSNSDNELIHSVHSGIKPLKGFIFPVLITLLYKRKHKKSIVNN